MWNPYCEQLNTEKEKKPFTEKPSDKNQHKENKKGKIFSLNLNCNDGAFKFKLQNKYM